MRRISLGGRLALWGDDSAGANQGMESACGEQPLPAHANSVVELQMGFALSLTRLGTQRLVVGRRAQFGCLRCVKNAEMKLRQHRIIEVAGAKLECAVHGSGDPVVLLANAGCSVGYLDDLAGTLAASGLQAICINMRGVGESCGSLEDATLHDLAADVAGAIEVLNCGPVHLIGHAFGNRIARCLAVDRPSLVRKVVVLAAGGLIAPPTGHIGTHFRNASEVKMNGSDCVTRLGVRWLSPASDPRILSAVECWPAVFTAHLGTSSNIPLDAWWAAGTAPLLVVQGLDDAAAVPANGYALREQFGERVRVVDLPHAGHFMVLEQPEAVARAVLQFLDVEALS